MTREEKEKIKPPMFDSPEVKNIIVKHLEGLIGEMYTGELSRSPDKKLIFLAYRDDDVEGEDTWMYVDDYINANIASLYRKLSGRFSEEPTNKTQKRKLLEKELKDYAKKVNGDWQYDENKDMVYTIILVNKAEGSKLDTFFCNSPHLGAVIFRTRSACQQAIEHFGERLRILFEKEE